MLLQSLPSSKEIDKNSDFSKVLSCLASNAREIHFAFHYMLEIFNKFQIPEYQWQNNYLCHVLLTFQLSSLASRYLYKIALFQIII